MRETVLKLFANLTKAQKPTACNREKANGTGNETKQGGILTNINQV